jgi:hypothetical protein
MGAGRGKGLFKPNNMSTEAATGPTGDFCGSASVTVDSFSEGRLPTCLRTVCPPLSLFVVG